MIEGLLHRIKRLSEDEQGTSLTEFALALPIFVLVLGFIYYMGAAGHVVTTETNKAHRNLWAEVLPHTQSEVVPVGLGDPDVPHVHPGTGAQVDQDFLTEHEIRQRRPGLLEENRAHELETAGALSGGGHWGESHRRTRAAAGEMVFRDGADQMAHEPTPVIGGSEFARGFVDDRASASPFEMGMGGAGALAPAATYGSGQGLAPVLGAGMRYGVVHNVEEGVVEFPNDWTLDVRVHFDVLVPPTPVSDERIPVAISRMKMEDHQPYRDLLGIATDQRLSPAAAASSAPSWPGD